MKRISERIVQASHAAYVENKPQTIEMNDKKGMYIICIIQPDNTYMLYQKPMTMDQLTMDKGKCNAKRE